MTPQDLMTIKDRHAGQPLTIILKNGMVLRDGLKGNVIILDQEKLMGHAIRYSNLPYVSSKDRFELVSFIYSDIVSITTNISKEDVDTLLDKLVADAVIEESHISLIQQEMTV